MGGNVGASTRKATSVVPHLPHGVRCDYDHESLDNHNHYQVHVPALIFKGASHHTRTDRSSLYSSNVQAINDSAHCLPLVLHGFEVSGAEPNGRCLGHKLDQAMDNLKSMSEHAFSPTA